MKKFWQIQQEFAPSKDTKGYNYKYSNLNSILPKLKELGAQYSLMLTETKLLSKEAITINNKAQWQIGLKTNWLFKYFEDGERQFSEVIEMISYGTQSDADKAIGTALTYARRYVLLNIFNANDGGEFDPEQKEAKELKESISKPTPKVIEAEKKEAKPITKKVEPKEDDFDIDLEDEEEEVKPTPKKEVKKVVKKVEVKEVEEDDDLDFDMGF